MTQTWALFEIHVRTCGRSAVMWGRMTGICG